MAVSPDGVSVPSAPVWENQPRAPLWELIKGVFWGEAIGAIGLAGLSLLLAAAHLLSFEGTGYSLYWPWHVHEISTLLGDLGWAALVVTAIAKLVCFNVQDRTDSRLSLMWTWIAVAVGGYVALALPVSAGTRLALAVVGPACVLRVAGFERSGAARPWPRRLDLPRYGAGILAIAFVLAAGFSVLHPFRLTGSGGSETTINGSHVLTMELRPNKQVESDVGFDLGGLPTRVTDVKPLGAAADVLTGPFVLTRDDDTAVDWRAGMPVNVPYGHQLWVRFKFSLLDCPAQPATALTGLRLKYRALGFIDETQTVKLKRPVAIRCVQRHS
jgi:hypothetical protein